MKALSICQPWAFAILHGNKRVENRTWATSYRGPLLIHAGKSRQWFDCDSVGLVSHAAGRHATPNAPGMHFGALVGVARLVACAHVDHMPIEINVGDQRFVEGPLCWVLDDVREFANPIPWRGQQGLFDVPDEALPPEVRRG